MSERQSGFIDGRTLGDGQALTTDVCIIGSGAGGAVTAAQLAAAGFEVLIVEEGGHHTKSDFVMREDVNYPMLYQEAGGRRTKAVRRTTLQGRPVGGTTRRHRTTSCRPPAHGSA